MGEYLSRAADMRELALNTAYPEVLNTAYPEVRKRLLLLAAGFERLADQVDKWESASLATAAD